MAFKQDDFMILDGGLATELVKNGHSIDDDPLWSARLLKSCPSALTKVHKSFLEAGSDVIITSSYQASIPSFVENIHCTEDEAKQLICLSVNLANAARDEFWTKYKDCILGDGLSTNSKSRCFPLIAGSVGPYGACLHDASEYTGTYVDTMSEKELMDWHRPRLALLVESGVDIIAIETIPALKEALAIAKLLKEFPGVKAWVTFTCMDGTRLSHGETFSEAVAELCSYDQVFGFGVNCVHPSFVESLLRSLEEKCIASNKIKIVYPNSGEKWENNRWISCKDQKLLADYAKSWINTGATWIGGCCRTTPEDVKKLRGIIRNETDK
eukprot:gene10974-12137_t